MFPIPTPEVLAQTQEAYTDAFWIEIWSLLGIDDIAEQQSFKKAATLASAGYLQFIYNNPDRLQPSSQTERLENYKATLEAAKKGYEAINKDTPTRTKFHDTLQVEYNQQTPQMQQMLSPYQERESYTESVFYDFLNMLIRVCENAKTRNIGSDGSIVSKNALLWWIAIIGHSWPKSSQIKFQVGDYKAPARNILFQLIRKIDSITDKDLKTAMRKVIVKGQVKHPAELLLE